MKAWYNDEMSKFTQYGQASPDMGSFMQWGHYTQVVWKDSNKLGCATHHCASALDPKTGKTYNNIEYIVCNYGPAGKMSVNLVGMHANNLPRKRRWRLCEERFGIYLLRGSKLGRDGELYWDNFFSWFWVEYASRLCEFD